MTRFLKLDSKGHVIDAREINQRDMLQCPHCIMAAEHYREDGSCKCNDMGHMEMKLWGYEWKDGRWQ